MTTERHRRRRCPRCGDRRARPDARIASLALLAALLAGMPSARAACLAAAAGAPACDAPPDPGSGGARDPVGRHVGNPIDVVTGNKYQPGVDYRAVDSPLAFVRHYNSSLVEHDIGLGRGWRHSYSVTLTRDRSGIYRIAQSDGRLIAFAASGEPHGRDGATRHAARDPGDGFLVAADRHVWHLGDGREITFVGSFPVAIAYPDGQRLRLRYRRHRLESVTDDKGRRLRLVYAPGAPGLGHYDGERTPSGHLAQLELPDGSTVRYGYDARLNLVGAIDAVGIGYRYGYGDPDWPDRLTALDRADGHPIGRWGYDDAGRAHRWRSAEAPHAIRIDYPDDARIVPAGRTLVIGPSGSVEAFEWATVDGGTGKRVVRRSRLPPVEPPNPSWAGMEPIAGEAGRYVAEGISRGDVPERPARPDLPRRSPTEAVAVDVPVGDGAPVPAVLHVDRFGETHDVQLGATRLGDIADILEADAERLRGARAFAREPRGRPVETLAVRAARLARRPEGASAASSPETLFDDAATLIEFAPLAEAAVATGAYGGLQPRGKQFGSGEDCPLPKNIDCEDVRQSREMAELSACAYPGHACATSFRRISPESIGMQSDEFVIGGVPVTLYHDSARNQYTLAFRGTESGRDWYANIRNGIGFSSKQYTLAARLGNDVNRRIVRRHPDAKLNFTGHSLGGGLATMAAVRTDRNATVFNSAGLHSGTARWNGVDINRAGYLVQNVWVSDEPVSSLQNTSGRIGALLENLLPGDQSQVFAGKAPGYHTEIPKPRQSWIDRQVGNMSGPGAIEAVAIHSIGAVLESLDSLLDMHCRSLP